MSALTGIGATCTRSAIAAISAGLVTTDASAENSLSDFLAQLKKSASLIQINTITTTERDKEARGVVVDGMPPHQALLR